MRKTGLVVAVALLPAALVVGLELQRPGGASSEAVQPTVVTVVTAPVSATPRADASTATSERAPTRTIVRAQEAVRPPPPPPTRRTTYRRRSRNRYPGPIPTPADWRAPDGPVKIALQAGHWRANEAPRELSGLKDNGTAWRGTAEWEVNLDIAQRAAAMLEELGYEVDVLPAVVPPNYRAHLFIAIHADGSNDSNASGYRVAAPRQDATGRASQVVRLLEQSYGEATGLRRLPTVTRRMQSYYAFNFRRYEHSLHPMTIGVIIETGFLTSPRDRQIIMDDQDRAARGIVEAVTAFPVTASPDAQTPTPRRGRD